MGVKNLSQKLRDSKVTPDEFARIKELKGKKVGVNLSVVAHKGLGTDEGAGLYHFQPKCPNSEIIDKCTRL